MTDEELAAIKVRFAPGYGIEVDESTDWLEHIEADSEALLAEVEAWRKIGREVLDDPPTSADDMAGPNQCVWCNQYGDEPRHTVDCPVTMMRALLGQE